MEGIWHLLLCLTTSLVTIPPLIASQDVDYSWSKEVIKNTAGQNSSIQTAFDKKSHLTIPLNINLMRPTQLRKKRNQIPESLNSKERHCNRKIVFPPLPSIDLKIPYSKVVPAQQLLVTYACCVRVWKVTNDHMLFQRKCIPQKPVTFLYMMLGKLKSPIVSPS